MITEFIVCGNHPFSTVEQEKFKIIFDKGFPNRRSLTRKTLMSRVWTKRRKYTKKCKRGVNINKCKICLCNCRLLVCV